MNTEVLRAIEVATSAHHGQMRKWSNMPYIVHPLRVMWRVNSYCDEKGLNPIKEDMLCISALHDVLEDTDYPPDSIQQQFGEEILEGVQWLTNASKGSKKKRAERKRIDREHLKAAPYYCKIIKLHDRLDNLLDMKGATKGFLREVYIPETLLLLEVLEEVDKPLTRLVREVCKHLI